MEQQVEEQVEHWGGITIHLTSFTCKYHLNILSPEFPAPSPSSPTEGLSLGDTPYR